jgi:hypothetical protein
MNATPVKFLSVLFLSVLFAANCKKSHKSDYLWMLLLGGGNSTATGTGGGTPTIIGTVSQIQFSLPPE